MPKAVNAFLIGYGTSRLQSNATGAGAALPDSKYEVGDEVIFRETGDDRKYGDIISADYYASQKTRICLIHTGELLPHRIPEKDIPGKY